MLCYAMLCYVCVGVNVVYMHIYSTYVSTKEFYLNEVCPRKNTFDCVLENSIEGKHFRQGLRYQPDENNVHKLVSNVLMSSHSLMHAYINAYIHIFIHTYIYTLIRTYINSHKYIHICTRTHTHTYTHKTTHTLTQTISLTHTYIYIYIHTLTYTHTYIHIHKEPLIYVLTFPAGISSYSGYRGKTRSAESHI